MSYFFGYEINFCNVYQLKNMLSNSIDKAFYMDFVALSIPFPITIWMFLKPKYPRLYIQFCVSALLTCSALFASFDCHIQRKEYSGFRLKTTSSITVRLSATTVYTFACWIYFSVKFPRGRGVPNTIPMSQFGFPYSIDFNLFV